MNSVQQEVLRHLDKEFLVDTLVEMVSVDSPTGYEAEMASLLGEKMTDLGLAVQRQEVEEGRQNVIARWGSGGLGTDLMFLGHLDTAPGIGQPLGAVRDGWVVGKGAANMKAAFPCYLMATKMLMDAGLSIDGSLMIAGVCGEIERAPVGSYQGRAYRGGGFGARYMVSHGVLADFVINGEPTGRRVQIANNGYMFVKLTTFGVSQHTAYREHGVDAIAKMIQVMDAVYKWEPWYQEHYPHDFITPRVGIGAIEGGYPPTPARSPADRCDLYVDITLLPNTDIQQVYRDFRAMLLRLEEQNPELHVESEVYMTSKGYQISADDRVAQAVRDAHIAVNGAEPPEVDRFRCNVSSDNSPLFEYGVRGVTYGPAGISRTRPGVYASYDPEFGEAVSIDDLVLCTKAYALSAIDLLVPAGGEEYA